MPQTQKRAKNQIQITFIQHTRRTYSASLGQYALAWMAMSSSPWNSWRHQSSNTQSRRRYLLATILCSNFFENERLTFAHPYRSLSDSSHFSPFPRNNSTRQTIIQF